MTIASVTCENLDVGVNARSIILPSILARTFKCCPGISRPCTQHPGVSQQRKHSTR
jgi:hypothetical protein